MTNSSCGDNLDVGDARIRMYRAPAGPRTGTVACPFFGQGRTQMAVSEELKRVTSSRLNWLPGVRYDDIIEFVARVKALKTYNAILGNSITVLEISIIQAQLIAKSG